MITEDDDGFTVDVTLGLNPGCAGVLLALVIFWAAVAIAALQAWGS